MKSGCILVLFTQNPKHRKSTLLPDHRYFSHLLSTLTTLQDKWLGHFDPLLTWGECPVPYTPGVPGNIWDDWRCAQVPLSGLVLCCPILAFPHVVPISKYLVHLSQRVWTFSSFVLLEIICSWGTDCSFITKEGQAFISLCINTTTKEPL